jgi:aminoglycoside phosphotransferase (APT) family kinase protein
VSDVGRLLASGRDGDIYEYGPGLVLRRTRRGRVIEHEARVMEYAAQRGFPVPRVHEVRAGGTEIVMERLVGPMMMDVMAKRPQTLVANTNLLADLHDRLHELSAPDWLTSVSGGGSLLHLDLHPMNVMMTGRGPVVIDWTNAASGDPLTDVGLTYVLLTCPRAPMPRPARIALQPFRVAIARVFARRYRGGAFDAHIAHAAELKMLDPNMLPDEVERCRRLAVRRRSAFEAKRGSG